MLLFAEAALLCARCARCPWWPCDMAHGAADDDDDDDDDGGGGAAAAAAGAGGVRRSWRVARGTGRPVTVHVHSELELIYIQHEGNGSVACIKTIEKYFEAIWRHQRHPELGHWNLTPWLCCGRITGKRKQCPWWPCDMADGGVRRSVRVARGTGRPVTVHVHSELELIYIQHEGNGRAASTKTIKKYFEAICRHQRHPELGHWNWTPWLC